MMRKRMCQNWTMSGYHPTNSTVENFDALKNERIFWKAATEQTRKLRWRNQETKTKNKTENSPSKLLLTESWGLQQPTQEEEGQERRRPRCREQPILNPKLLKSVLRLSHGRVRSEQKRPSTVSGPRIRTTSITAHHELLKPWPICAK